jgi:hypothetical protein
MHGSIPARGSSTWLAVRPSRWLTASRQDRSITQGVRAVGPQLGPDGADATKDRPATPDVLVLTASGITVTTNFSQLNHCGQG